MVMTAALMMTGCSSDDGDTPQPPQPTPQEEKLPITIKANVWQMMDGTRATTFDNTDSIQSEGHFFCTAYDAGTITVNTFSGVNSQVDWDNTVSKWTFADGVHRWPDSGSLDFFAYMPATQPTYITAITYAAGAPSFTCDMRRTVDKEFIWALTTGQNKETNGRDGVTMTFKHPFARIYFQLSEESGTHIKINSITISGSDFYHTGTCTLSSDGTTSTSTWSNKGGAAALGTLDIDTPYIVIPNDYGSNESTKTISVEAEWDDWSKVTKTITSSPLTINWQAGFSYTYTLTISKYGLKVDTSKYTEQW